MKTKTPPQLIRGDCAGVLETYPSSYFDFACFSPPYDNIRDYKGFAWKPEALRTQLYRVLKDNSICAMVIQDQTDGGKKSGTSFTIAADWITYGWGLFETVIYYRDGRPGNFWARRFRVDHEYIFLFLKGKRPEYFYKKHMAVPCKHPDKKVHSTHRQKGGNLTPAEYFNNATKCRGTIWKYATSNSEGNTAKLNHPATYPDALARDLILCFCPEGGNVIDPMCGSGTTLVAAESLDRNGYGIDISEEYCELTRKRLAAEIKPAFFR